ncbi:uncharacterized protein LOC130781682 [Actinidia eriantha]|uniref:uncharacterized protein LOC130781682 n=1 Tax=Actinidia eriantha TaxID=165200 RepID=UPI00258FB52B|nr:uncharacterized protein LOC130781682 [Actinidia eriantha]XP_057496965.1 uncharacterized protein LOC130781682 [Actinidia eriantha]
MASAGEEDNDAVLSDVEADDPVPISIKSPSPEDVSAERFREVLAELDRERQAREAAENSKSDLEVSFNRLKALAHEAIKKRDECGRQRDEALREKDETLKQRDEIAKQFDEAVKAKDSLRSEMETGTHMLVTGIEKISGKVSNFKNFNGGGLPKSQKYTGLPAVAYGVIKRTNDIVEELLRQIESTAKSRNEAREQMDQRNYEIAIEVSQLEATINGLREEVSKKTSTVENLEKAMVEKDGKMSETEKEMSEKLNLAENEVSRLTQLVSKSDDKLRNLELKADSQRPLLVEQLNLVSKIHDLLYDVIKIVDAGEMDQSDLSESMFLPRETDIEENIRASLAGMESICELTRLVVDKTKNLVEDRNLEVKILRETASQLAKEKELIGSLLRSTLSRRASTDLSSKTNELFKVAENGLRKAGIDFRFGNHIGTGKDAASYDKADTLETEKDEIYALAGALENIIKQSQLEIIGLKHSVEELGAETCLLKEHVEAQTKELNHRKQQIEELEEKERVANENVEGLMMDIAAAEEEITRWKLAAQQEAAAGKAVEQEFVAQLSAVRHELEEAKQAVVESEKKLKFKEETAAAAMAARDAAEKSLRLADMRASRLRDRVEELTQQLEQLDTRQNLQGLTGPKYVCWPWEWLGLSFVGAPRSATQQQSSNEMELSEPLL